METDERQDKAWTLNSWTLHIPDDYHVICTCTTTSCSLALGRNTRAFHINWWTLVSIDGYLSQNTCRRHSLRLPYGWMAMSRQPRNAKSRIGPSVPGELEDFFDLHLFI